MVSEPRLERRLGVRQAGRRGAASAKSLRPREKGTCRSWERFRATEHSPGVRVARRAVRGHRVRAGVACSLGGRLCASAVQGAGPSRLPLPCSSSHSQVTGQAPYLRRFSCATPALRTARGEFSFPRGRRQRHRGRLAGKWWTWELNPQVNHIHQV